MQQVRPEETVLDLHGLDFDENDVFIVSLETPFKLVYSPQVLLYNPLSGVPPREAPFRSIDLGEVALRSHPT